MRRFCGVSVLGCVLACVFALASAARADTTGDDAKQALAQASELFRSGAAKLDTDRSAARDDLLASIDAFGRLIDESHVRNGKLYYNIANAHLLMGDTGRAILNYRRAQTLIPGNDNLRDNLAQARRRVPNRIDAPAETAVRRALLFWHDGVAARTRWHIFLGAWSAAWVLLLLRTTGAARAAGWWPALGCAAIASLAAGSLVAQERARGRTPEAVVVAEQAVARKGPDANAYQPSFTEPLRAGVEVEVVEQRPGWVLARLADGREAWLPADSVELVEEPS